jgi:hypothetical protein
VERLDPRRKRRQGGAEPVIRFLLGAWAMAIVLVLTIAGVRLHQVLVPLLLENVRPPLTQSDDPYGRRNA